MREICTRFLSNLYGRAGALFTFRLVLQPLVAGVIACRAGLRDAREGRPPYLWSFFKNPAARRSLINNGWKDLARIFSLAIVVDLIYQLVVLRWIYPLETLAVALIVALLPYLILRGLVNRLVQWKARRSAE